MPLPPNLNQHLLGHTNARVGYIFSQQEIEVHELREITADTTVTPVLAADAVATPVLSASIGCVYAGGEMISNCKCIEVVRGNAVSLRITLNADGVPITTLSSAVEAVFVALDENGDTVIEKTLAAMSIDDPDVGTVTIPLSSPDTEIEEMKYDIAIQVTWGPLNKLEWNMPGSLSVIKGIIP